MSSDRYGGPDRELPPFWCYACNAPAWQACAPDCPRPADNPRETWHLAATADTCRSEVLHWRDWQDARHALCGLTVSRYRTTWSPPRIGGPPPGTVSCRRCRQVALYLDSRAPLDTADLTQ